MNRKFILLVAAAITTLSACTTMNHSMREPNTRLELTKNDFTISDQFTAEAKTTKVFGIDFERLFMKKTGDISAGAGGFPSISVASIPVIGNYLGDRTANYSLYQLMTDHPGYDVVLYPQYETVVSRPIGLRIYSITTVKTTARLGKLKP